MSVDKLRASREKAVVVFTKFTRLYKQDSSALYCFFEGEDSQYYGIRIRTITRPEKDIYLSCNGKEGVLGIYRMLSSRSYYASVRAAYFIDRDFDQSIYETAVSGIYETPCYAIENFYTSSLCFSRILKSEFKLTELDENFKRCVSLYERLQKEFHDAVELINTWIACHRDISSDLKISRLSILDFVRISLDKVTEKYTIDTLYEKFPHVSVISQQKLDDRRAELKIDTRQKNFRGKFEIEFLFKFLQKLQSEANTGKYPYFTSKVKVVLSLTQKTMISDLSQYADTPECLYTYLESLRTP